MGMSPSKISRIETGITDLQIEDVAAPLGLYQVPAATRDDPLDLVRRAEERGWWTRQPGLPQLWRSLIDFEAKATRVQNYEASFVPGLLQTAEYARAVIEGITPTIPEAELGNLVAARMARQAVLTRASAPDVLRGGGRGGAAPADRRARSDAPAAAPPAGRGRATARDAAGGATGSWRACRAARVVRDPGVRRGTRAGPRGTKASGCSWRKRSIWRPTGWRWGLSCRQPLHPPQRPS
jgi:Domain of unknown function (DUF5753)